MKALQSNESQVTTNNNNARACFNYQETWHYIANCPYAKNKPVTSAFSNSVNGPRPPVSGANNVPIGSNNKGNNNNSQQPYGRARVNHINAQEAQGVQGVVLGVFLVSSIWQQYYLILEHHTHLYRQALCISIKYPRYY